MSRPVSDRPRHPLIPPREVDPRQRAAGARAGGAGALARARRVRGVAAPARGREAVGLLRGPAHGERPAGLPPRALARVQGHLPALSDDARLPRRAQGRLGLPRPAGGDRGRTGAGHPPQGRDRGVRHRRVQREVPRVGVRVPGGVEPADRADRLLDRSRARVPHAGRELHRVGVVGAGADRRARAAVRGPQGRAVLPALRDDAVLARGRARLQGCGRPERVPEAAGGGRRGAAAGVDDDAVDAAWQRGGGGLADGHIRTGARR